MGKLHFLASYSLLISMFLLLHILTREIRMNEQIRWRYTRVQPYFPLLVKLSSRPLFFIYFINSYDLNAPTPSIRTEVC